MGSKVKAWDRGSQLLSESELKNQGRVYFGGTNIVVKSASLWWVSPNVEAGLPLGGRGLPGKIKGMLSLSEVQKGQKVTGGHQRP